MQDKPKKQSSNNSYYALGVKIMLDMGFSIAVPAVLAALAGQYVDEKYGTNPLFIILFLLNAFLISVKIIIEKAKRYGKEYDDMDK